MGDEYQAVAAGTEAAIKLIEVGGKAIAVTAEKSVAAVMHIIGMITMFNNAKWKGKASIKKVQQNGAVAFASAATKDPKKLKELEKTMEKHGIMFAELPRFDKDGPQFYMIPAKDVKTFNLIAAEHYGRLDKELKKKYPGDDEASQKKRLEAFDANEIRLCDPGDVARSMYEDNDYGKPLRAEAAEMKESAKGEIAKENARNGRKKERSTADKAAGDVDYSGRREFFASANLLQKYKDGVSVRVDEGCVTDAYDDKCAAFTIPEYRNSIFLVPKECVTETPDGGHKITMTGDTKGYLVHPGQHDVTPIDGAKMAELYDGKESVKTQLDAERNRALNAAKGSKSWCTVNEVLYSDKGKIPKDIAEWNADPARKTYLIAMPKTYNGALKTYDTYIEVSKDEVLKLDSKTIGFNLEHKREYRVCRLEGDEKGGLKLKDKKEPMTGAQAFKHYDNSFNYKNPTRKKNAYKKKGAKK